MAMQHLIEGPHQKSNSCSHHEQQPYIFSGNIGLGFHLAGAIGVAGSRGNLATNNSSTSGQLESQPCASRRIHGLMFLANGSAGVLGVALVFTKENFHSVRYHKLLPVLNHNAKWVLFKKRARHSRPERKYGHKWCLILRQQLELRSRAEGACIKKQTKEISQFCDANYANYSCS